LGARTIGLLIALYIVGRAAGAPEEKEGVSTSTVLVLYKREVHF